MKSVRVCPLKPAKQFCGSFFHKWRHSLCEWNDDEAVRRLDVMLHCWVNGCQNFKWMPPPPPVFQDSRSMNPQPLKLKETHSFEWLGTVYQWHSVTSQNTGVLDYATVTPQKLQDVKSEMWGSYSSYHEDCCLLGCDTLQSDSWW